MKKTSILKRMLISVLAIAMVLTAIPMTTVTAQAAPTAVKKVVIKQGKKNVTKKTIKLAVGKSSKIKVVVKPSKAKKSIKYVSGNKKVATVSKSGKIKAKAAGTTKIKVTVTGKNKKKKTTWVKVKVTGGKTEDTPSPQPSNSPAPSQAPAPQPAPAMVNGSVQLPIANATSSDPSIATVDATGKVTAGSKAGTVTISGKDARGNDISYTVSGCVEWKIQEPEMSMKSEMTPTQARQLLGDKYNSEYTYDMSVPAGQETGNAFIYVSANGKDKDPFAYPSIAEENANILYSEKYPIKQEYLLTDTTNKMVQPLSEKEYTISYPEDGDICINAKTAGYMQIGASINVADKVKYNVHSSIQWCPAPSEREITSTQFYAVAGETVKLTAKVTSKNATNVKDVGVNWEYDSNEITVDDAAAYKTNADGEVTILLKATKAFDLGSIKAELANGYKDSYNIKWYVAGQEMTTDVADIYWVMPGIYYDNSALKTGDEYYTNQALKDVVVDTNSYTADSEWLLGVKVVGTGTKDQVNRDDEFYVEHDITISNIGLELYNVSASIAPDKDTQVTKEEVSTGTWLLTNAIKGGSKETISVTGKADNTKPCIITIDGVAYTSVGMLSEDNNIAIAKNLIIPITWGVTDQQILSIETPSGNIFNVANTKAPVVYFKVVDNSTAVNPVAGVEVSYTLKDDKGNEIKKSTAKTTIKGIYELRLTDDIRPDVDIEEDATWTLSASIKEEEPVQKNIIFKVNDNTTFGLKKVESSGTDKKVTVTFENGRISTTDAVLPSMFELKDENKNIVKVVKVEKDAYNSNVLILTTDKTFTGDISCTINNEVVDDATGYTVQLLDSVGHLFQTNANKALNVQNLETSVSDDDVSEEYEELEEIEF